MPQVRRVLYLRLLAVLPWLHSRDERRLRLLFLQEARPPAADAEEQRYVDKRESSRRTGYRESLRNWEITSKHPVVHQKLTEALLAQYTVGGMDVMAVVGGGKPHDKVVIFLHGGGENGEEWVYNYNHGWFGDDLTGFKLAFPTSPDHVRFGQSET